MEYEPNQAEMKLSGSLVYYEPEKELNEILELWKKEKKMTSDVTKLILNNVLIRCHVKALGLAQDVGLPPQIRLPMVTTEQSPKKQSAEYTG